MILGAILFKYVPMHLWGADILYDASAHLMIVSFFLYIIWFFIDQNRSWRIPYFIFCALVLSIVSLQRIEANAHNDIGLLMGLLVVLVSIAIAERKRLKGKIKF